MKIIVPIGISGSGKSTMYNDMYNNINIVCPDQIRLELTGDISDQSKNGLVFKKVDELVEKYINDDVDFFYDATNVNTKYRKQFINGVKKYPNVEVIYVLLPANVNVSYNRIKSDLMSGINRSNVPIDVLNRQYNMYIESIKSDLKNEGANEVVLLLDKVLMKDYINYIDMGKFTEIKEI